MSDETWSANTSFTVRRRTIDASVVGVSTTAFTVFCGSGKSYNLVWRATFYPVSYNKSVIKVSFMS
jgi:hypothetical protein